MPRPSFRDRHGTSRTPVGCATSVSGGGGNRLNFPVNRRRLQVGPTGHLRRFTLAPQPRLQAGGRVQGPTRPDGAILGRLGSLEAPSGKLRAQQDPVFADTLVGVAVRTLVRTPERLRDELLGRAVE
jgi:hypothetical protein